MRLAASIFALLALMLGSLVSTPAARAAATRVAIIVGPVGTLTPEYRAIAAEGAAAARAAGADVVEVVSPNATWKAARAALQGASIVIYLGHGNGFPSPYSKVLNRETQDGLGLNPVAGVDDEAHRYFGEAYLAREVRLAPNAIVLLHRLCYASGNSEQRLPEGSLADSQARADNYAAGFIDAGASVVVADAFASPGYYVHAILAHDQTIEAIWRSSPTFHGHVQSLASKRTSGATELLDPTQPNSGFYRSLVGRLDVHGSEVRATAHPAGGATAAAATPAAPAALTAPAAYSGPAVDTVQVEGRPVAATQVEIRLHVVTGKGVVAPAALGVATRWTLLEIPAGTTPSADASAAPVASATPLASSTPGSSHPTSTPPPSSATSSPQPTSSPLSTSATWSSDDPSAIAAEEPSALIVAAKATKEGDTFRVTVSVPERPGLYRLTVYLLDGAGAAYDAETQASIPAVLVRVNPALAAAINAPVRATMMAGAPFGLDLVASNTGSIAWAPPPGAAGPDTYVSSVEVLGRWVALGTEGGARYTARARFLAPAPGASASVVLAGTAPALPGEYLISLDLDTAEHGSLTFAGALEPVVIRVTVLPPTERRVRAQNEADTRPAPTAR